MDIDAYAAAHRDQWHRLDQLVAQRRLTGAEADELVTLYRATAGHFSRIRTGAPDPALLAEMSTRIAAARGRLTGTREARMSDVRRFWLESVPAALYRVRWWTAAVTIVEVALAVVVGVWTLRTPEAMSALGSTSELDTYAQESFEAYYSTYAAPEFAGQVWTNNARIAAICVASGITGVLPAYMLLVNAVSLGQAAAIMADHGLLGQFFALITPHGLLELTCIFIAGGAGLKLFWVMLAPGGRSRSVALAAEGRSLITVAAGLTVALAVSGFIEAFVTPSPLPWVVKGLIGVLALAVLWVYTLLLGRRAVLAGNTGDLRPDEAGAVQNEVG
ncbi:stage II sporulation protein M [Actinomyces sp. MRS3W]|uniref:stage II sporulation protein M n=1 Tax=Actinomyces sp. MRS3W TaxID=2800796 RepID=UPI0028FD5899|nr:stage II sporulation protein M [Actinomyces sp. MRS3W]MDU0349765.1 stage II sporulation protein M [Actinomyces sp. MRS3W]